MPFDPAVAKSLFLELAAIEPKEARSAKLLERCAEDVELCERVNALLEAHDRALCNEGTSTHLPADEANPRSVETVDRPGRDEHVGAIIAGKYKLIEAIGEGGMGSVFMALQTEPVRRAVAVKVIKAGMDTRAVLARFEAERQALAMMDHPNIARVLDAGSTESGRPFFVMELVKGVPITQFCDERKMTTQQRLELFVPVCHAIQHAHQKGVIHRDIKPTNVLVAMYDDRPVPKVIDFGVAKAAGQALTEMTLMTGFGAVVGTPEYMSPEQATLNNMDVDTRSDIYSLGVLLYELLTGSTPVDRKSLGAAAILEILRIVREVDAPRPSAKLSTINTLPNVAANRSTEPGKLSRLMQGELDWIIMKSLEKDRTRRYETANGFGMDIQRYLAGDLVEACPPTLGYRLRKAYRKHRTAVRVTTAFICLMIGAVAMGAYLAVKAKQAEALAEEKRIEAEENAIEAMYYLGIMDAKVAGEIQTRQEAVMQVLSRQIDLDLISLDTEPEVGLLRLSRTLKESLPIPPTIEMHIKKYNTTSTFGSSDHAIRQHGQFCEFMTAAILATGQNYALLLPPITHDGQEVRRFEVSPDSKTLLTIGEDGTARLWDIRTAKLIAILRQGTERVVNGGFSPDGKMIFTDDTTGMARFWEPTDGKYRARVERGPNNYAEAGENGSVPIPNGRRTLYRIDRSECAVIGKDRLLTQRVVVTSPTGDPNVLDQVLTGPVELWDTASGKLVTRLDHPDRAANEVRFLGEGNWVTAVAGKTTGLIYSAVDGRELARLVHPAEEVVKHFAVSPDGRRLATVTEIKEGDPVTRTETIRLWDTETWRPDPITTTLPIYQDTTPNSHGIQLFGHDIFGGNVNSLGPYEGHQAIYRHGSSKPLAIEWWFQSLPPKGEQVADSNGRVYDARTWQPRRPPAGKRYHPDLALFALDGRYFHGREQNQWFPDVLIDTRTHKQFPNPLGPMAYAPEIGLVTVATGYGASIRVIPPLRLKFTAQLDLPANESEARLLELWAQVAVRGELGQEGEFVKWDEATWEKKRQELAAVKPPYPDLPFPGYVARDKLHWLRAEYSTAPEKDKLRLVDELLRRAEAIGDQNEAVRWRLEREKYPELLAMPREQK